ncbi:MAG: HEAT repeat domain-containing protein, partial [Planctomycetes bacterium]|nr:HEAT repeat domain-containing protein [Planctomycetota bacterium]
PRAAARTLAMVGVDADTLALLRSWVNDDDYLVRAEVVRSLRYCGRAGANLLVERLRGEADPFVRRVAAETLAHHKSRATGEALVDYLEQCKGAKDFAGERTAQLALQRMVGKRGPRTPAAWREAAASFGELPVDANPAPAAATPTTLR